MRLLRSPSGAFTASSRAKKDWWAVAVAPAGQVHIEAVNAVLVVPAYFDAKIPSTDVSVDP